MGITEFLINNWFQILTFLVSTIISITSISLTLFFDKKNKKMQKEFEEKSNIYKRFSSIENVLNDELYPQISIFLDNERINKNHVDKITKIITNLRRRVSYIRYSNSEVYDSLIDTLVEIQDNAILIFIKSYVKDNKKKLNKNTQKLIEIVDKYLKIK